MTELKKEVGLFGAVIYGVGLILGAGIYTILGEATGLTGESIVLAFGLSAMTASLTGLSYAELSSIYPREEADYLYVLEATGDVRLSEVTALLRILVGIVSAAAVSLAFAGYLSAITQVPAIPVAIGLVVLMTAVNLLGISVSLKLNILFTLIEVAGLAIIIYLGFGSWGEVDPTHLSGGTTGLLSATFLIFFAYVGFESLVNISEETVDATETVPRAILLSIAITTLLYVLVGLSAVGLVDWAALAASSSPLALVAEAGMGGDGGLLLSTIALFSTTNTVLILLISTSRVLYGVSKEEYRSLPSLFSKVNTRTRTPHYAVLLTGLLTTGFALLGDVGLVAGLSNLFLLVVFALVNLSLILIRGRRGRTDGFRVPGRVKNVPLTSVAGLVTSLLLSLFYLYTWL